MSQIRGTIITLLFFYPCKFSSLTSFGRNHEYYNNEPHESTLTENVASISGTASKNLDVTSISESEVVRNRPVDSTEGLQSEFPSVSSYGLPTTSQSNATTYTYLQEDSQVQNISPLSSLMVSMYLLSCFSAD